MFRWLKDRKKGKKQAEGGVRSKEDDYGFKQGFPDMKRDLPPTPDVTSASSAATDDDRSVHIYEEIPDLPFRCTPEGELRIRLVRESDGGGVENCHLGSGSAGGATRDVSPYMVVPLERLMGTPLEFRPPRPELHGGSFAGAVVGHQRRYRAQCDGCSTSCTCEGSSEGTTTPSWDDSSVFSSTLGAAAGGGGSSAAGDISDRLLSAINLTRLLTAIRLSSSSADTLTTSPICIGMDKDGKNFSVSLNVTPVSHTTAINDDVDEDSNNNNNEHLTRGPDAGDAPGPGEAAELDQAKIDAIISKLCPDTSRQHHHHHHHHHHHRDSQLHGHVQFHDPKSSCQDGDDRFGDLTRATSECEEAESGLDGALSQRYLAAQRGENSDTCCEYDVSTSTSSESDQVSYDYYLAKVQRTRSLECAVQKLIRRSDSDGDCYCDSDGEEVDDEVEEKVDGSKDVDVEEEEEVCECAADGIGRHREAKDGFYTGSRPRGRTTRRRKTPSQPEAELAADSDDGTMADMSESENSSGYYESAAQFEPGLATTRGAKEGVPTRTRKRISSVASEAAVRATRNVSSLGADGGPARGLHSFPSSVADPTTPTVRISLAANLPRDRSCSLPSLTAPDGTPLSLALQPSRGKSCKGKCSSGRKNHHHQHSHHHHHHSHRHRHCRHRSPSRSCKHPGERCRSNDSGLGEIGKKVKSDPNGTKAKDDDGGQSSEQTKGGLKRSGVKGRGDSDKVHADSELWTMSGKIDGSIKQKHCPGEKSGYKDTPGNTKSSSRSQRAREGQGDPYDHYFPLFQQPHHDSETAGRKGPPTRVLKTTPKNSRCKSGGKAEGRKKTGLSELELHPPKMGCEEEGACRDSRSLHYAAGEVYSIPTSLPDPSATSSYSAVRALKSVSSVPSKLSLARHIPESSEVYGTRGGANGSNNRLLSDLIMLNYNRQVFNHV
ncbi:hypothetical protein C0Q70_12232 [Pomacea canaliculata]|uniref:Uncharacterized protein n=1 Tax=Pomacea canaliculata TaxID=400727 RepID=A0A2T7P0Z6_POMCA|nr:hypothetical protein C0Q70_12232 [Pomacea canaliculata]